MSFNVVSKTAGYLPSAFSSSYTYASWNRRARFAPIYIPFMLEDPRIILGMGYVKGTISSKAKCLVTCANHEMKEYIKTQLNNFWLWGLEHAMRAFDYGYIGCEVLYRVDEDGHLHFDRLLSRDPQDTAPMVLNDEVVGIEFRRVGAGRNMATAESKVVIGRPNIFWHVHRRQYHYLFGRSRLFGAFPAWWEKNSENGFRDIRRLWFYRHAFDGGTIFYPPGETVSVDGEMIPNAQRAQQLGEQAKTGGFRTCPVSASPGVPGWDWRDPNLQPPPVAIIDYGNDLNDEMLEGLEVPPEVIRAGDDTGALAGRRIPMEGFMSMLQSCADWLFHDFDTFCLKSLVAKRFGDSEGKHEPYELTPWGLSREVNMPGTEEEGQGNKMLSEDTDPNSPIPGSTSVNPIDPNTSGQVT